MHQDILIGECQVGRVRPIQVQVRDYLHMVVSIIMIAASAVTSTNLRSIHLFAINSCVIHRPLVFTR